MDPDAPWHVRLRERFRRVWHTENARIAVVRDVAVAGGIVLLLLASIWIYAGQPLSQAPVVSVESGSMMHGPFTSGNPEWRTSWSDPAFGRIGTIDPGDIVFVKRVERADQIETAFGAGGRGGYGGHGDVVVYKPNGSGSQTRVIHRAMLYIEAQPEGCTPGAPSGSPDRCTFRIPGFCNNPGLDAWNRGGNDLEKYCAGSEDPVVLNLERDGLFLRWSSDFPCPPNLTPCPGYPKFFSGFITKGDNNAGDDQHQSISSLVRLNWIIGKARGEIPWFGIIKLALYGNPNYNPNTDPTRGSNWKFLAATAPWDIWLCLLFSLVVLVTVPMLIDVASNMRAKRRGERPPGP